MPRRVTPATSLDNLKKEAKRRLKLLRSNDNEARARLLRAYPAAPAAPVLRDVQHALAIEYGFANWMELKQALEQRAPAAPLADMATYDRLAHDMVLAHDHADADALARLNQHYARSATFDDLRADIWRRVYAYRRRRSLPNNYLQLSEAQAMVAADAGFGSWTALAQAVETGATPPGRAFAIDADESRITPRRHLNSRDWDELLADVRSRRIAVIDAEGHMTDAALARIAGLEHVTSLRLAGSREVSDAGLMHLRHMPQLEELDVSGTRVTDGGLEVLRHLPNLRRFGATWQGGISDAGVSHLRHCEHLEEVRLMGTSTGDGVIAALQGKPKLRRFDTGRLVSDAGLPLLHNFPQLKKWHGPLVAVVDDASMQHATRLLIDGPFTDRGLASLAGLEGVFELHLFWNVTGVTAEGFRHLRELPNLGALHADEELSSDAAMRHIAAIPRLRSLFVQESVASDEGFAALGRCRTLESLWGRRSPHFGNRGFLALASLPALRTLGIGFANVNDDVLSQLERFPALRQLTPIDVDDNGFRHVGKCKRLERLLCMYCRDTGDLATEHIAGLQLKYYYAGLTNITDASLEILGRMPSLEEIELYETLRVTDAGLALLARLPRLRKLALTGLPEVTFSGTQVFPARVRVQYSL